MVSVQRPHTHNRHKMLGYVQVMREVFDESMAEVWAELGPTLSVNGDGRFDTPGHSAMYGLYSLMDSSTSKIVASALVKVSTVP